jgi:hypothetical protein
MPSKDLKRALFLAHNNTHSTSRIFRNVELIKRETESPEITKRLDAIEVSCRECREQVDELYLIIKKYQDGK